MNEILGTLFAYRSIDFQTEDGESIAGTQFFISRDAYSYENGWGSQIAFEKLFNKDDSKFAVTGSVSSLPCEIVLVYEPQGRRNVLSEVRIL